MVDGESVTNNWPPDHEEHEYQLTFKQNTKAYVSGEAMDLLMETSTEGPRSRNGRSSPPACHFVSRYTHCTQLLGVGRANLLPELVGAIRRIYCQFAALSYWSTYYDALYGIVVR